MQTVALIDYGSGNLHSAAKAFERAANDCPIETRILVTSHAKAVAKADRIVLPGVGAFADCKAGLIKIPGLIETLQEAVVSKGRPFLGICVGMQLLATRGLEFTTTQGLDWIPGDVRAITPRDPGLKIPHMGWNTLQPAPGNPHGLLTDIPTGPTGLHAYFVHSFTLNATDTSMIAATTDYGGPITAMVTRNNIAGTQFHPEKSQTLGLKLISNFLTWRP